MGADVERRAFQAVADAAAAALTSVHLATTARFDSELLARAKEAAWKRDSEGLGGTSEDSSLPDVGGEAPGDAPREWTRGDGEDGDDEEGGDGGEEEGGDGDEEEGGDGEVFVDPDSNAGLALRWRLCHKRALQRAYRAAAARVEEASGGGGGGGGGGAGGGGAGGGGGGGGGWGATVSRPRLRGGRS